MSLRNRITRLVLSLTASPILGSIAAQAAEADQSRRVSADVIAAIKQNDIMRFTACESLGGLNQSCVRIAQELEAISANCASTAWCLWNHLCTFHLFCGLLGPDNQTFLAGVTQRRDWVCFPAGASTAVRGEIDGDTVRIKGQAAFGSGARYAEWAGVAFVIDDKPQFSLVDLRQHGVNIQDDWQAMSLRASATDTVIYDGAGIPLERVVDFPFMYRVPFRHPDRPMIHQRYREDWVALSDMWLGAMAVGVTQAALDDVTRDIRDRIAIMGVKIAERPTVHVNLGQANAMIQAARDNVDSALRATDERMAKGVTPTEGDYLQQLSASMMALQLCDDAMKLLLRVMGGNGLRQGASFERRYRDLQAMPLHINAHRDRISEQSGRHLLGLETENPF